MIRRRTTGQPDWNTLRARLSEAAAAIDKPFEMSSERAAAILDERARLLAASPEPEQETDLSEFVIFRLGKTRYGLESRYVQAVFRLGSLVSVPGMPDAFLGITNLRGILLPVADLRVLFDLPRGRPAAADRLIVLRRDGPDIGVIAESVDELAVLQIDASAESPADLAQRQPSCVRGVTPDRIILLHAASLLDEPGLRIGRPIAASI
jgi:purine-binding chemotaxis protein CheW